MSARFDVIVIGAGHNGLAAAEALAKRGKSVCVVEQSDAVGGMACDRLAHLLYNPAPGGVETREIDTVSLSPEGAHVLIRRGEARFTSGQPHPDAAAYQTLYRRLVRYASLLHQLAEAPPPGLEQGVTSLAGLRELSRLAKLGVGVKRLGKAEMREFLRILLTNAYDLLLECGARRLCRASVAWYGAELDVSPAQRRRGFPAVWRDGRGGGGLCRRGAPRRGRGALRIGGDSGDRRGRQGRRCPAVRRWAARCFGGAVERGADADDADGGHCRVRHRGSAPGAQASRQGQHGQA